VTVLLLTVVISLPFFNFFTLGGSSSSFTHLVRMMVLKGVYFFLSLLLTFNQSLT
jgi:hypothetical protein